jgi:hypothetical protein
VQVNRVRHVAGAAIPQRQLDRVALANTNHWAWDFAIAGLSGSAKRKHAIRMELQPFA